MHIGNNIPGIFDDSAKKHERQSLPLDKNTLEKNNQSNGKPDQTSMRYTKSQPSVNIETKTLKDYHNENQVRHLKFRFIFSKIKTILNIIYIFVFRDHLTVFQLNKRKVNLHIN